MRNNKQINIDS